MRFSILLSTAATLMVTGLFAGNTDKNQTPSDRAKEGEVQGEGDYVAGRRFQEAARRQS